MLIWLICVILDFMITPIGFEINFKSESHLFRADWPTQEAFENGDELDMSASGLARRLREARIQYYSVSEETYSDIEPYLEPEEAEQAKRYVQAMAEAIEARGDSAN